MVPRGEHAGTGERRRRDVLGGVAVALLAAGFAFILILNVWGLWWPATTTVSIALSLTAAVAVGGVLLGTATRLLSGTRASIGAMAAPVGGVRAAPDTRRDDREPAIPC